MFKNLPCLSVAFRIKLKHLSVQLEANLSFLISYHSLFPKSRPQESHPCRSTSCSFPRGRVSGHLRLSQVSFFQVHKIPIMPFRGCVPYWRDTWKNCQSLSSSCSLTSKMCVGGRPGDFRFSITRSVWHRGRHLWIFLGLLLIFFVTSEKKFKLSSLGLLPLPYNGDNTYFVRLLCGFGKMNLKLLI